MRRKRRYWLQKPRKKPLTLVAGAREQLLLSKFLSVRNVQPWPSWHNFQDASWLDITVKCPLVALCQVYCNLLSVDGLQIWYPLRHGVSGQWTLPARARGTRVLQCPQHCPLWTPPTHGEYLPPGGAIVVHS